MKWLTKILRPKDESKPERRILQIYFNKANCYVYRDINDINSNGPGKLLSTFKNGDKPFEIGIRICNLLHSYYDSIDGVTLATKDPMFNAEWKRVQASFDLLTVCAEYPGPRIEIIGSHRCTDGSGYISFKNTPYTCCGESPDDIGIAIQNQILNPPSVYDPSEPGSPFVDFAGDSDHSDITVVCEAEVAGKCIADELKTGDRVSTVLGEPGVVTLIDPSAEHGLGVITVRLDNGEVRSFGLVASGLTRM